MEQEHICFSTILDPPHRGNKCIPIPCLLCNAEIDHSYVYETFHFCFASLAGYFTYLLYKMLM